METRKVTIINSKTQSQKVIQDSKATTLGELKAEMMERGIDFSGMTFFEGHMRAELKDDASPLPTNIPYKGQIVNDLTFLLTAPEKKVKSGAMSRAEAYDAVKRLGLQDKCKRKFGKNFTQCATADLISLVKNNTVEATPAKKGGTFVALEDPATATGCNCSKALTILTEALYENGTIEEEARDAVITALNGGTYSVPEEMSKREIDEMFDFVGR